MKKVKVISFLFVILLLFSSCGETKSINTTTDNDIKFQLSTDHFVFYSCDKDKKCLKDFSDTLNDNYERILNDLDVTLYGKVAVYIYPDIDTYHKEINRPNAPDWSVGSTRNNNTILMVSPLNPGESHS